MAEPRPDSVEPESDPTEDPVGAVPSDDRTDELDAHDVTDAHDEADAADEAAGEQTPARSRRSRRATRPARTTEDDVTLRSRPSLPLVPVLAGLLVLLVAATAYLFLTRPDPSSVRTGDYVDALQAARAGIVDVASFDHLTLDDDIQQIRSVTTGDLQEESVGQLDARRQEITDAQAVVNTEVVGAAVGAADEDSATVYMVIQSTQRSNASEQTQVQRYRIEVDLTKDGDRWLLSGITGR